MHRTVIGNPLDRLANEEPPCRKTFRRLLIVGIVLGLAGCGAWAKFGGEKPAPDATAQLGEAEARIRESVASMATRPHRHGGDVTERTRAALRRARRSADPARSAEINKAAGDTNDGTNMFDMSNP